MVGSVHAVPPSVGDTRFRDPRRRPRCKILTATQPTLRPSSGVPHPPPERPTRPGDVSCEIVAISARLPACPPDTGSERH